jgi:hypothetical protein
VTQDRIEQSEPLKPTDCPKLRELTEQEMAAASGGFLVFTFKLVAVKTVSWT